MSNILSEALLTIINLSSSKKDLFRISSLNISEFSIISCSSYVLIFLEKIGFKFLSITSSIKPLLFPYNRKTFFLLGLFFLNQKYLIIIDI